MVFHRELATVGLRVVRRFWPIGRRLQGQRSCIIGAGFVEATANCGHVHSEELARRVIAEIGDDVRVAVVCVGHAGRYVPWVPRLRPGFLTDLRCLPCRATIASPIGERTEQCKPKEYSCKPQRLRPAKSRSNSEDVAHPKRSEQAVAQEAPHEGCQFSTSTNGSKVGPAQQSKDDCPGGGDQYVPDNVDRIWLHWHLVTYP